MSLHSTQSLRVFTLKVERSVPTLPQNVSNYISQPDRDQINLGFGKKVKLPNVNNI